MNDRGAGTLSPIKNVKNLMEMNKIFHEENGYTDCFIDLPQVAR